MINMNGNADNDNCKGNNVIEKEWKKRDKDRPRVRLQWYITRITKHPISVKKLNKMTRL